MIKGVFKIISVFLIGMAGGIFADQILWPYLVERPLFYQYQLEQRPIFLTEKKEIIIQENTALKNAIGRAADSIVAIRTRTKNGKILEGSGVIITSDGLMVTLAELVPWGSNFSFFVEGKRVGFQILKRDLKNNLALVKLDKDNLSTVSFSDINDLAMGERVFLLGFVFKKGVPLKSINEGIVKRFSSEVIKTNIIEKPSLSGSPLFNIKDEIVGLVEINSQGEVWAIPVSKIRSFAGL